MRKERRTFNATYKAKVAIEAIKEQQTTSELAQKLLPPPNKPMEEGITCKGLLSF